MLNARQYVSELRRQVTSPLRAMRVRRMCAQGLAPINVLFYHRVADTHPNAWTISCDQFEEQMDWIRFHFDVIDMQEVQRRLRRRDSRRPAVHITFDDGYAENCRFALPLLVRNKMPATYFVTYHHTVTGEPFPHDVASDCPLPVNSISELKAISESGIDLGFHTRTHCDCGQLRTREQLSDEIILGNEDLQGELGMPLRYFAFPFGLPQNIPVTGIQAVYEAGFECFCSAYGAYNLPGQDAFHIRRIHGDPELWRLKNWLTFDKRKLSLQPEIRYWLPPANNWAETLEAVG